MNHQQLYKRVRRRRAGMATMYAVLLLPVLIGFVSLGVDVARVRLTKAELATAVDAAARYAAGFLPNGPSAVKTAAVATAAGNSAGGAPVILDPNTDIIVGTWDVAAKKFTAGGAQPNAVKIDAQRSTARGNAIPLVFASMFGQSTCDVHVSSITVLSNGSSVQTTRVDGTMNVYLSGMPSGTYGGPTVSGTAPANSPSQVPGLSLTAGQILKFNASGSTADDPSNINQNWTPDGQPLGYRTNDSGYLNGMSQLFTQQGALVGVFLDDNPPTTGGTPPPLDITGAAMDFSTISPQLRQPFFIGDGKTSGGAAQQITVPSGATRLFLGVHDNINWSNNSGYFLVNINGAATKISFAK